MHKLLVTITAFFTITVSSGQTECVSHWSKNGISNEKLDSILTTVSFKKIDSLPCSSSHDSNQFDYKWYIDFYTEQLGDYFSEASCVNFAKRFYKKRKATDYDEVRIVQFVLPKEKIAHFENKYGRGDDSYRYFKLKLFTLYKFVVKGDSVYFIYTESYHQGEKISFMDMVTEVFIKSQIE